MKSSMSLVAYFESFIAVSIVSSIGRNNDGANTIAKFVAPILLDSARSLTFFKKRANVSITIKFAIGSNFKTLLIDW